MDNTISASIRKLATVFIVLFIALSGGLVYWQVVVAQQVKSNTNINTNRSCLLDSAPIRGRILDRNGVVLADESKQQGACGYIRHYTDPSLAGLIGYYVGPNFPPTGLEAHYDDYLSGRVGLTALNNTVNQTLHRPPVGDDIYLTIDERIQQIVNKHFDDPITIDNNTTFRTDRGSVIVTDPHTGEILAMLSRPGYDPNKMVQTLSNNDQRYYNSLATNKEQPLLERPIRGLYAPGSTYKTMTLLAGLDSGNTNLNEAFDRDHALGTNNAVVYNGQVIGPVGNNIQGYTIRFPVTTEYGFTHSDNIIFAQIGVHTGAQKWLDYNNRMYVGQKIPFDLPVSVSSVLRNGQPLATNELAADSFGQGYDFITPMQMSLIDDVVANNGQLMHPMVVEKVTDPNNAPMQTFTPQPLGAPQLSQQTATAVRQAMYGVINCGSGSIVRDLFTSQFGIIGKTGTAEVGGGLGAHSWLITQAPYTVANPSQLPALTIVAMKENGGEGGASTGPMIAHMYSDIFSTIMKNVPLPAPPDKQYCCTTKLLQIGCPA